MKKTVTVTAVITLLTGCGQPDPESTHAASLTFDSHVDIPFNFASAEADPLAGDMQVNLERMQSGGLDAAFFIVYVGQTDRSAASNEQAAADALVKFSAIHRMTDELYPDRIGLAYAADDVQSIIADGRLAAAIGIENGFVIGRDLDLLDHYYSLGARYMTLVHNGHNDIADSAQPQSRLGDGDSEHGGISDFGAEVIQRMNELGIMVDISHASKEAAIEAMDLSIAPVIASHSSVLALTDHVRNMDDETLERLAEDNGVIQIVAYPAYVGDGESPTVADLIDHIDYVVDMVGIEHVGISSDFGGGGGIAGWDHAGETLSVTAELVARGYSADEIDLIWSGNLLRVWREAESVASSL